MSVISKVATRDWEEDFADENGNYQCRCLECNHLFLGYKRRQICKLCSVFPLPKAALDTRLKETK